MSSSKTFSSANEDCNLVNLLDKYIKSSDNLIPLQAYIQYLEDDCLDVFSSVSCVKSSIKNTLAEKPGSKKKCTELSSPIDLRFQDNTKFSSTLVTIDKSDKLQGTEASISDQGIILAQRFYKIIISIDYSVQISNIDFIQKSLEKIFDKISIEYDQFYENCMHLEPAIYVTVILWNSTFFQCPQNEYFFERKCTNLPDDEFIPFKILCHAKRLLKYNLDEIATHIFDKLNEAKHFFLKLFKQSQENCADKQTKCPTSVLMKKDSRRNSFTSYHSEFGSFEHFLINIIRIFSFFSVNEFPANVSAPSALSIAHHVYITDGLLHVIDMVECLEKISKSSIVFSFLSNGSKVPKNNISSGFGYVKDHYLMKFFANVTNGFYAIIDENLDYAEINSKNLLYFPSLYSRHERSTPSSNRSSLDNQMKTSNMSEETVVTNNSESNSDTNSDSNTKRKNSQSEDETQDSFSNAKSLSLNYDSLSTKDFLKTQNQLSTSNKSNSHRSFNNVDHKRKDSKENEHELGSELKFVQKYEIKNHSLHQIIKFRAQEGFYLVKITKHLVKQSSHDDISKQKDEKKRNCRSFYLVTIHFKRYFTQTTILIYRISYYILRDTRKHLSESALSLISPSYGSNNQKESSKNQEKISKLEKNIGRIFAEVWISWNFLHLKAKYQNLVLIDKIRQTLNMIHKIDLDKSFELTTLMLNPPELLSVKSAKEPLFKMILLNDQKNNQIDEYNNIFSINSLNFELNIRSNKEKENEFIKFAKVWLNLAFFRYSENVLKKNFGVHTLQIVMDHDRPVPDAFAVLFDLKKTYQLNTYEIMKATINANTHLYDADNDSEEFMAYQANLQAQLNHFHILNLNHNINNIFQCQNSLNKLNTMLIEWCDIMLVENCVFLKFCVPSARCLKSSLSQEKVGKELNKENSLSMLSELKKNKMSPKEVNENDENTRTRSQSPIDIEAEMNIKKSSKTHAKSSNTDSNTLRQPSNNSFVIIKIDAQHVPFVTLEFLFHSSISYLDRMRMLQKFKEKLRSLNLKNISSNIESPISTPVPNPSHNQNNKNESSNQKEKLNNNSNKNLGNIENECCHLLQKPDLFNAIKVAFLDERYFNSKQSKLNSPNRNDGLSVEMSKFQTQILNFMEKKEFKWKINKSFSYQTSLNVKETIIDSFVRIRLKEGFKCLFQNSQMAVFCLQLAMFDSDELYYSHSNPNEKESQNTSKLNKDSTSARDEKKNNLKNKSNLRHGSNQKQGSSSSQCCTLIYVINFSNEIAFSDIQNYQRSVYLAMQNANIASPPTSTIKSNTMLGRSYSNNGLLNIIHEAENRSKTADILTKGNNVFFNINKNEAEMDNLKQNNITPDSRFVNVSFTTELYSEIVDGVFREQKNSSKNNCDIGFNNYKADRKKSKGRKKFPIELKENFYFQNLNYCEILNLIFLSDFKTFLTLQSSYALFLQKNNYITNLYSLLNLNSNVEKSHLLTNLYLKDSCADDLTSNIFNNNYNVNFYDSIRILPDLRLLPKKAVKLEYSEAQSAKRRVLEKPIGREKLLVKFQGKCSNTSILPNNPTKENFNRKKKCDEISLPDQLKSVLDCITDLRLPIVVDFQFNLRGILLESSLFLNVFEDVPLSLFKDHQPRSNSLGDSSKTENNNYKMSSVKKIQRLFFQNIDDYLMKMDGFHLCKSNKYDRGSPTSTSQEVLKNYESINKELKNALILKLRDIKSTDSNVKQIIESLSELNNELDNNKKNTGDSNETENSNKRETPDSSNEQQNFKFFFKFNVAKVTSETHNTNQQSSNEVSNNWYDKIPKTANSIQQNDTENRFFVFGFFFLNAVSSEIASSSAEKSMPSTNQHNLQSASNQLVFFLFSCVPDNIKHSIVNSQSNTYLIRKPLFSNQKVFLKNNNNSSTNTNTNSQGCYNTYQFYSNKEAKDTRRQFNNNSNSTSNNTKTSSTSINPTPSTIIKKSFSISDILRDHSVFDKSNDYDNNYDFFFNYVDHIEENCAKSYIKSVVHYLGLYATQTPDAELPKETVGHELTLNDIDTEAASILPTLTSVTEQAIPKFEKESINQLLKIGRKIKLIDLDLTKYLRVICSHLKGGKRKSSGDTEFSVKNSEEQEHEDKSNETISSLEFDWNECYTSDYSSKLQYLEKKFDELIRKRFNMLPGFEDLFIFTPSQSYNQFFTNEVDGIKTDIKKQIHRKNRRPNSLDFSQQNSQYDAMNFIERELNASPRSFDEDPKGSFEYNFDETDDEKFNDNTSYDDHDDDDDDDDNDEEFEDEYFLDQDQTDRLNRDKLGNQIDQHIDENENFHCNNDENSNTDFENYDDIKIERSSSNKDGVVTFKKVTKKKGNKKFKSSSPFSYQLKNKLDSQSNKVNGPNSKDISPSGYGSDSRVSEQIIGVEFVVIIGNDIDLIEQDGTDRRTRTTTLTTENNDLNQETTDNPQNEMMNLLHPTNHLKKTFFFSNFTKFNQQCLLNLIEEKDMAEFRNLVKQLEGQRSELDSENFRIPNDKNTNPLVLNDVHIHLRFNWYSFNELRYSFNELNTSSVVASNQPTYSLSSKTFTPFVNNGATQLITNNNKNVSQFSMIQQQQIYQFNKNSMNTLSNIPFVSNVTSGIMPENNNGNLRIDPYSHNLSGYPGQSNISLTPTVLMAHKPYTSSAQSSNSSTSTINNPLTVNITKNSKNNRFEYYHILNPTLNEFRWHLNDEIFQFQQTKIKNKRLFLMYIEHIREGAKRKYTHCRLNRRKIVLNKKTLTTIKTPMNVQPSTRAARIQSIKQPFKTNIEIVEDKTILNVDGKKFFQEFVEVIKNLEGKFYDCKISKIQSVSNLKLQRMNQSYNVESNVAAKNKLRQMIDSLEQMNNSFYYLTCTYEDPKQKDAGKNDKRSSSFSFKILIKLINETLRIQPSQNFIDGKSKDVSSPTNSDSSSNRYIKKKELITDSIGRVNYVAQQPIESKQIIDKETVINQLKINTYYSFSQSSFKKEDLIESLMFQFDQQLNSLIKLVYLTLTLREIHDTRKWNSLLVLNDKSLNTNCTENNSNLSSSSNQNSELTDDSISNENKSVEKSESSSTAKNQAVQGKLSCTCVWNILFKLHRLHQTVQKKHGSNDLTPSTSFDQQIKQQSKDQQEHQAPSMQQQFISQGLKKLQESLVNFRIEESNSGDLYVYTRKNEIFLLKLEEVYEIQNQYQCSNTSATSNTNDASNSITNENESNHVKLLNQNVKISAGVSRRPSYASADFEAMSRLNPNINHIRLNHPGNSSISSTTITGLNASNQQLLHNTINSNNTLISSSIISSAGLQRPNPEYIRLSVYGLTEPDEEMKQDLCKTLQSELDYWLLIKMCNSIDKNTYKTTSAQHPDKITEEDLTFFKQICENYFDFEIPLPFIFNFSKTMRENFFFFIKQIFNSNFKSIDATSSSTMFNSFNSNQAKQNAKFTFTTTRSKSQIDQIGKNNDDEYDELASLIYNNETHKQQSYIGSLNTNIDSDIKNTTQSVSSQFTHLNSFSFMSMQPPLGPFEETKSSSLLGSAKTLDSDSLMIPLSRILFHNSKNIGKHRVSLVLVEALYAIKSLDVTVLSRVTRSNSIGSQSNLNSTTKSQNHLCMPLQPQKLSHQQQQVLETSYMPSKQTGPTFVYRFYCRGENDTYAYKVSLEAALNDALLYFLSEYMTRIEPELYMKQIELSKVPVQFRKCRFTGPSFNKAYIRESSDRIRVKRRHKSTGSDEQSIDHSNLFVLTMNKTARHTSLGKLIANQKINSEQHLNQFILNNLSNNLFDHRNYQETIEYFRETIRSFKFNYNDILDKFCQSELDDDLEMENPDVDLVFSPLPNISSNQHQSISLENDTVFEKNDSNNNDKADSDSYDKETEKKDSITKRIGYCKSHLRIIYEWLKGLYLTQATKGNYDLYQRSNSVYNKATAFQRLPSAGSGSQNPTNSSCSSVLSPLENQPQNLLQSSPLNIPSNQQQSTSFVLRKKINYKTKYNLTGLIRDLEFGLRETCKPSELNINYFSFTSESARDGINQPLSVRLKNKKRSIIKIIDDNLDSVFNESNDNGSTSDSSKNEIKSELKSCLRNKNLGMHNKCEIDEIINDEVEFGDDFQELKLTNFSNLQHNLSKSENLIITLNVEYGISNANTNQMVINQQQQQSAPGLLSASISSTNNSTSSGLNTIPTNYNRISSFTGNSNNNSSGARLNVGSSENTANASSVTANIGSSMNASTTTLTNSNLNSSTNNVNSLMMKSMSSNSGELESSMSLSSSLAITALQLKRTYLYALVSAKSKAITFYCFTTDNQTHDSIKQLLEQLCETILQRYHLANNTVLYKFGGLIGDSLIYDLKKVKSLTLSATQLEMTTNNEPSANDSNSDAKSKSNNLHVTVSTPNSIINTKKLSSSPKFHRHLSYKGSADNITNPINPNYITNLQFSGNSGSGNSSSYQSSTIVTLPNSLSTVLAFKQIYMTTSAYKAYDNIINMVNQQISFCAQYLTMNSNSSTLIDLINSPSILTNSYSNFNTINRQNSSNSSQLIVNNPNSKLFSNSYNLHGPSQMSNILYGVGMNYQLLELQQIYRHPRKIYEIAVNIATQTSNHSLATGSKSNPLSKNSGNKSASGSSSSNIASSAGIHSSIIQSPPKMQLSVNDFYKNYILPVLIPFHYCCSPILFCNNWNDYIVTENMLGHNYTNNLMNFNNFSKSESFQRNNSAITLLSKQQSVSNLVSLSSNNSISNKSSPSVTTGGNPVNELWYKKMRHVFLIEYSKFFESRGFIHLKDDRFSNESQSSKSSQQNYYTTTDVHHFIKWIQQDGFLYITINIEEIFMHIKLGYCTRYRLATRAFLNEMIKFFALEFHVHSFTYDYHLTAINRNFISPNQISQTISKFLDEFVEFFRRVPLFSTNKVFKIVYEKLDYSLIAHKFDLIFENLISAKKKINKDGNFGISFTPLYLNLDNNIGIYSISDTVESNSGMRVEYCKYLVIKIESFQGNTTNALSVYSASSLKKKFQTNMSETSSNPIKPNSSTASSKTLLKASNSSSTSSFNQLANQSDGALLLNNQTLQKIQSSKQHAGNIGQQQKTPKTNTGQQQSYIRLVCYYLCMTKNQHHNTEYTIDSNTQKKMVAKLNDDLMYLDKVIEESISGYKQEIFWDNLIISMSSLSNLLNEDKSNMPIVFAIQSEELEQILESSEKIDALSLDSNLYEFLNQCFTVKDKIRSYFEFSFGRHFIFTSCDLYDYCLLLINDDLINKFGCSSSSSIRETISSERRESSLINQSEGKVEKQLDSFVLLKFNKKEKNTSLWQVNRVKQTAHKPKYNVEENKDKNIGSNKYLSFVVNNLLYVLWESLFLQS